MSKFHSVEAQLRCWQPRRPTAGLKQRLFGAPVRVAPRMTWVAGWLAPMTACALLAWSVFISGSDFPRQPSRIEPMATTTLHQSFQAPVPAGLQQRYSNLLSGVFDLTNQSVSTSSISALTRSRVN